MKTIPLKHLYKKRALSIVCMSICTLLFVACSSNPVQPQTKSTSPIATPTSVPSSQVLYRADWSRGLGDWQSSGAWKVVGGQLQIDTTSGFSLTVPYKPTLTNYAIEVRLRIVSVPVSGGSFTITADHLTGKDGYQAGILGLLAPGYHVNTAHPQCQVLIEPGDSMQPNSAQIHDCELGSGWLLFRVAVRGSHVDFYINDVKSSYATSEVTDQLSNGPIHLAGSKTHLEISDVRVLTL